MNTTLLNIVKRITAEEGEGILAEPARLKSFVRERARDIPQDERRAFGRAVEHGAYHALKNCAAAKERRRVKQELAQTIHDDTGIDKALCAGALDVLDAIIAPAGPPAKPAAGTAKKIALKIAAGIALLCIAAVLRELKNAIPAIMMDKALKESEEIRKESLPAPLPAPEDGWERVKLPGIGSIDIPPGMERPAGIYADITNEFYQYQNNAPSEIIFQQKGLNEFSGESFQSYARVMLDTTIGNPGDYESLYFIFPKDRNDEIKEIDAQFRSTLTSEYPKMGIKILSWNEAAFEIINGMSSIHFSLTRQLHDRPVVLVHNYIFQNRDRMYFLTLSYQLDKEAKWKDDFEKILHSFRITDIKSELSE
jgi:hypothetical protein